MREPPLPARRKGHWVTRKKLSPIVAFTMLVELADCSPDRKP